MTHSGSRSGKIIAIALCLLLVVFMTAEAGHIHDHSQSLQHPTCPWCSMAHMATLPAAALSLEGAVLVGEIVAPQELRGRRLPEIFLHHIRPPPILQTKDTYL